jgi:hypothetical protein
LTRNLSKFERPPSLPLNLRLMGLSRYQGSGHRPARRPTYQHPRSAVAPICSVPQRIPDFEEERRAAHARRSVVHGTHCYLAGTA